MSTTLSKLAQYNNNNGVAPTSVGLENKKASTTTLGKLQNYAQQAAEEQARATQLAEEGSKNNGGFFGGLGYLGEKIGLGFLSGIEGIWDYTAGGLAKLFGADDWAEQQFANDWVNYNHADEWYNPSDGWKVAGDVAGGIGTSLPAIAGVAAAAAIAYFSGGSLSGVSAGIISGVVAGLGAAGNATKEAYRETGELGGKEFGYGALSGITEGAVEGLSSAIGAGTGAIVKNMTKSFGKEVAKTTAKAAARETVGKAIIKGFVGEAFEEGLSEFLDPYWKRITYDPNAKNATAQEIGYAALIGGLSGAIMGGFDATVRNTANTIRGNNIVNKGATTDVITTAENIANSDVYTEQYESFSSVKNILNELQTSLQKTDGEVRTVKQKMLLGYLERANTYTVFEPMVQKNAARIVANADAIAERLNTYGYTDTQGKPITVTADQIRSGIDPANPKSYAKALKENNILRTLAVIDATGQLYMDTKRFEASTLAGEQLSSQVDLNRFIENATQDELHAVAEKLDIADWQGLTNEQFKEKITAFVERGGVQEYRTEQRTNADIKAAADAVDVQKAKTKIPQKFTAKKDGVTRYTTENVDMAIVKSGDSYRIYDYETGKLSKPLTLQQVNAELAEINGKINTATTAAVDSVATEESRQAAEIDKYATENIPAYSKLSDANKSLVRGVIRQARAAGISETDSLSYARVAAHAGVNVSFDKQAKINGQEILLVGKNTETQENIYADGVYFGETNTIYVNPEAKRSQERLLIHELTHAIYNTSDGKIVLMDGVEKMSTEEKKAIIRRYSEVGRGSSVELIDEINAHFAEGQLQNKKLLKRLTEEKPSLKQKILSFFKKTSSEYSSDERLSGVAKKLYRQYKKLFDTFAAENQHNNAFETTETVRPNKERFSIKKDGTGDCYVDIESETFSGADTPQNILSTLSNIVRSKFNSLIDTNGQVIGINQRTAKEWVRSKSANALRKLSKQAFIDKANAFGNADELLRASKNYIGEAIKHGRTDNFVEFARGTVSFQVAERGYEADIIVGTTKNGAAILYDIVNIQGKKIVASTPNMAQNHRNSVSTTNNSISESTGKVNTKQGKTSKNVKYALPETDSRGKKLSAEQRKFFSDSKVVDEQGRLLEVYHGTNDVETKETWNETRRSFDTEYTPFTVFKKKWDGQSGHFFGRDIDNAGGYGSRVYKCYLNIKKPLIIDCNNAAYSNITFDGMSKDTYEWAEYAKSKGYDGVIFKNIRDGVDYGAMQQSTDEYVVFQSNQIKNTNNTAPTWLSDIRYALPEDISNTLFDDEFYKQFENEDKTPIRETLEELERIKASERYASMSFEESFDINAKLRALRAGYKSLYDYYVGKEKQRLTDDYEYSVKNGTYSRAMSIVEEKRAKAAKNQKLQADVAAATPLQNAQFRIIQETNPMFNDTSVGIRSPKEILTFAETLEDNGSFNWGDFSREDAKRALKRGTITVYSSYPIKNGVFVSTSYRQALDYAAGEPSGVHSRKVALDSVAWINGDEGQYAKVYKKDLRYALPDSVESDVIQEYGKTYRWSETGYLLKDGSRLNLSGEKQGGRAGYRVLDHRDIFDMYSDIDSSDAMIDFMSRGNIRVIPESPAINLQVEPTETQYEQIQRLVETLGWKNKEFTVDFDNQYGDTVDSLSYNGNVSARKVVADIRYYFKEGKIPYQSEFSQFRYALTDEQSEALKQRNITGDRYLDAEDLAYEIMVYGGRITNDAKAVLYHGTTAEAAAQIRKTGKMIGKEPNLYFSTKKDGIILDYGKSVVEVKIPLEKLKLNDIFDDELHLTMEVRPNTLTNVRFALPDTDSTGQKLSTQQREFFANSKVVDKDGKLLKVYHGTTNGNFFTFEYDKSRQTGTDYGKAFYFTTNLKNAKGYAKDNHKDPRIKEYDAIRESLKKQILEETDLTKRKELENQFYNVKVDGKTLLQILYDVDYDTGGEVRQLYLNLVNPLIADGQKKQYYEIYPDLFKKARENGNDGIIVKNVYDSSIYGVGLSDVYIAFSPEQIKLTSNTDPTANSDIRYALPDEETLEFLNKQKTVKVYRAMQVIDGELYPPMAAKIKTLDGKNQLVNASKLGQWEQSVERPDLITNGNKFKLDKANGSSITAAYNPYFHTSLSPLNDQFSSAYKRDNLVIVEGEIPQSELTSGYKAQYAKDSVGETQWHSGVVSSKLKGEKARKVILSRWFKPVRIVPDVEVAGIIAKILEGENISIPANVVTPSLRIALEQAGVRIDNNIRFALDDSDRDVRGNYTVGQRAKFVANNTGMKVYTRADAEAVINAIMDERLTFDDGKYGVLKGKERAAVVDYLFRKLNTVKEGYRIGVALNIADYLIDHTTLSDMYAQETVSTSMETLSILRGYMHSMDLRSIQGEIKYRYDTKNTINLLWAAPKGERGIAPDVLAQELEGYGITFKSDNSADIFLEMVDMYERAKQDVRDSMQQQELRDYGGEEQLENLRQKIAKDILLAYDNKGTKSKFAKLVEKYTTQIQSLKQQVREANSYNRLVNSIIDKAQKMKDLKLGTFLNATQYKSEVFKSSIEGLARIKNRGNFNIAGTRKILADLRTWYTADNPILADTYEQGIADMLDSLSVGNKKFTVNELSTLNNVMAYFTKYVETFNKVYKNGKWVEAVPEATRYIDTIHANSELKVGLFRKLAGTTYMQTFGDPMTVARRMDMYDPNGFYTETLQQLRDAAVDSQIAEMEVMANYDAFMSKNKKYLAEINKQTVSYGGTNVPKSVIIGLYMTLKRRHAQAGLAQNGFAFVDAEGKRVRVDGFAPNIVTDADLELRVIDEQRKLESFLTDADKQYIATLEQAYNNDAKKLKTDRDMQRLGFTNATEGYYYPIRRGNIAKNVDTSDIQGEIDRVTNSSFNKDTVRGAKQELFIESADTVFKRHVHAVCQYAFLSPVIETYNRIFNLDISGNPNKPVSVATESANTWSKGNKYFSKLISDIQGIPTSSGEGSKALGFIRSNYAKFQLGFNPKVWVTQLSSLFASSSILDADSITRGMFVSAKDVDTYCTLAKLRNSDNTVAMAQGVLDKLGKVSDVLMAPIGKMDRFVVCRLFGACQVQVSKNGGAKIGTEANKIAAGQLLRRVILETQQNSIATERSAAMRSGNEILRTVTMFTADSMKVVGRVIDSIGELSTLRAKLKVTTDANTRVALQKSIKLANKKVRKSTTALVTSALFMAAVAQLFSWLYNKDDKDDESKAETVLIDFLGNLLGGLPLIKDLYARIAEGYDFDNYAYSSINDLLDSSLNLIDTAKNLVSGDATEQDIAKGVKNLSYSLGQMFGIPTRNIYNVSYGLTKRISPVTAYKIDNKFYKKNYVSDLNKALENDDAEMAAYITGLIYNQRVGDVVNEQAWKKLSVLYSKGYSILPKSIGDTIRYDGNDIEMSKEQQARFKSIYSQANRYIEKMLASSSYDKLSEEKQAKAIKGVYDAYYYQAVSDLVGQDANNTLGELSRHIALDKLAIIFSGLSDIESDVDAKGKTVTGSKKKKTIAYLLKQNLSDGERLLIMCYRGYTIKDGDYRGYSEQRAKIILLKYILSLKSTSQAEKVKIAEECGFTVKNGKIDRSSLYSGVGRLSKNK